MDKASEATLSYERKSGEVIRRDSLWITNLLILCASLLVPQEAVIHIAPVNVGSRDPPGWIVDKG